MKPATTGRPARRTISGTYHDDGTDVTASTTTRPQPRAAATVPGLNRAPVASSDNGNGHFSYNGSGAYSNDVGTGSQEESGTEKYTYHSEVDYSLSSGAWHTSGGDGNASGDSSEHWSYSVSGASGSGTVRESGKYDDFGNYDEDYDLDSNDAGN